MSLAATQSRQTKILIKNGGLMKVKRIAECSPWSILQYVSPAFSDNRSSFLSGHLRQVLLYNQQSIYIYMHTRICVSVWVKYTTQMSTVVSLICLGPPFHENDPTCFAAWVTSAHQS